MAIDIRANVTCSLGTLISGSISDSYIQGSGLVFTTGSAEISGIVSPPPGTVVTFEYTKDGVTRSVPRKLRVMSSFADPFRRITSVELGCKLTYLSDLTEALTWDAFDDSENADLTEEDQKIITLPISASSIMAKCLTELGITASSIPLTNKFSIPEFDFSSGYVQILGDLLVSESYFGYLDTDEILQIQALSQDGGTGPVFTSEEIIDVGSIGVGQLPGEAVTVSYSTLKLKAPEITPPECLPEEETEEEEKKIQRINWEFEESVGSEQFYSVNYTDRFTDENLQALFSGASYSTSFTNYGLIEIINEETGEPEIKEVVFSRFDKNYGPAVSIAAGYAKAYLESGFAIAPGGGSGGADSRLFNSYIQISGTNTYYSYADNGSTIITKEETFKTRAEQDGSTGLSLLYDYPFFDTDGNPVVFKAALVPDFGLIVTEYKYTSVTTVGDTSKNYTQVYKLLSDTQHGQNAIASIREDITDYDDAYYIMSRARSGLLLDQSSSQFRTSGRVADRLEARPDPAERINSAQSEDSGDPDNGWQTESKSGLELAFGDASAQRRIEFSLPYAPDDCFTKASYSGCTIYYSVKSNAAIKANLYGRVQNRLLLGNRSGMNLQIAPERMPLAPFDPIIVQAAGSTALYRTNGSQWAFDGNGIVCSVDALFWGAIGGEGGSFWFPVAPGITELPETPPIVDGQMEVTGVVLPYNETIICQGRIRVRGFVTKFGYSLELLTEVEPLSVKLRAAVYRVKILTAEAVATILGGQDALLKRGLKLNAAQGDFAMAGYSAGSIRNLAIGTNVGTFNSTGWTAGLVYQRLPLEAEAGDIALTGRAAELRIIEPFPAQVGTFSVGGQAASLTRQLILSGDGASIITAGQPAQLRADNYFSRWAAQNYGFESLLYPDWWAE